MVNREIAIDMVKSFIRDCLLVGLTFKKVFLFGSIVKGTIHEGSDIDLILVSDEFNDNIFDNLNKYSKINIKYPIIETHPYPTDYFNSGDDFINEILKNSIDIELN